MPSLGELQNQVRDAVVAGRSVPSEIVAGGERPGRRIGVHRRNFQASLARALVEKFPGTVWLTGEGFVRGAAHLFCQQHPPTSPCIAEYGSGFPRFLSMLPGALRVPYLGEFAELEWYVGHVSIDITEPSLGIRELDSMSIRTLRRRSLRLQPGLAYFRGGWPVDELLWIFVQDDAPDQLQFDPEVVHLEIRGARGDFHLRRLDESEFEFRRTLWEGASVGAAEQAARRVESTFDSDAAVESLLRQKVITGIGPTSQPEGVIA